MVELGAYDEIIPHLTQRQRRILEAILSDYREGEPWARMTVAGLAESAKISTKQTYEIVKPLKEAGLILRASRDTWQVNPHYGWRGSKKSWMDALAIVDPPDMEKLK